MSEQDLDFTIETLGECRVASPMKGVCFVPDNERVLYPRTLDGVRACLDQGRDPPQFEVAGPRERIFFDPSKLQCGIVTCGGLCPGLNDVIRAVVLSLFHHYGVRTVLGFRFGYEGLTRRHGHRPLELTPESVGRIHETGGTILGSSRGPQDPAEMVDTLERMNVGILFTVGGDGTLRGARAVAEEARRRGLKIAVVGIPKTIDNDISFIQTSFGFATAVSEATRSTYAANSEASGARNGIGLVKLMGRDSGFIAAFATLADSNVDFCLIPEVPFTLEGFLEALGARLDREGHAVIVAAEGAGRLFLEKTARRDASGNIKHDDVGVFLRDAILRHFKDAGKEVSLKYIDPSYTIRSQPANPHDSAFCLLLGQNAAHAGMAGRTGMVVGHWNQSFTHVPIPLAVSSRKKIDPLSWMWTAVLASTGQPREM